MATEKQIAANRANAQKSTGPKTAEGKAQSRRNAIKHGLTGRGDVLPPEDETLFQERLHAWTCDARPADSMQSYLLATAVLATVRVDRCARNEFAVMAKKRRKAIAKWDAEQDKMLAQLEARLDECPCGALAALEETTAGCGWLLERLDELESSLCDEPGSWTENEATLATWLLLPAESDPAALKAQIAALAQQGPAADSARAALQTQLAEKRSELEQQQESHWREQDGPELAEAINLATFDSSHAGELRRRYQATAYREMLKALDQFVRLRKEAERVRKEQEQSQYSAPQSAGSGLGASSPWPKRNEPTAEEANLAWVETWKREQAARAAAEASAFPAEPPASVSDPPHPGG